MLREEHMETNWRGSRREGASRKADLQHQVRGNLRQGQCERLPDLRDVRDGAALIDLNERVDR